jgi:hypothetical protein
MRNGGQPIKSTISQERKFSSNFSKIDFRDVLLNKLIRISCISQKSSYTHPLFTPPRWGSFRDRAQEWRGGIRHCYGAIGFRCVPGLTVEINTGRNDGRTGQWHAEMNRSTEGFPCVTKNCNFDARFKIHELTQLMVWVTIPAEIDE